MSQGGMPQGGMSQGGMSQGNMGMGNQGMGSQGMGSSGGMPPPSSMGAGPMGNTMSSSMGGMSGGPPMQDSYQGLLDFVYWSSYSFRPWIVSAAENNFTEERI